MLKKMDSEIKSIYQKDECRSSRNFLFDLDDTNDEDLKRFKQSISGKILFTQETPNEHM